MDFSNGGDTSKGRTGRSNTRTLRQNLSSSTSSNGTVGSKTSLQENPLTYQENLCPSPNVGRSPHRDDMDISNGADTVKKRTGRKILKCLHLDLRPSSSNNTVGSKSLLQENPCVDQENICPPPNVGKNPYRDLEFERLIARTTSNSLPKIFRIIDRNTSKGYKPKTNFNTADMCGFCKSHGDIHIASEHKLRDETGKLICPKLRALVCPMCRATGDHAHTYQKCPITKLVKAGVCPVSASLSINAPKPDQ